MDRNQRPRSRRLKAAQARLEVISDTYLSMNAPMQWALPTFLEQRKNIQQQLLDRVLSNLAELDRQLSAQKTCQRLIVEAGWYAVLRVPVTQTDEELVVDAAAPEICSRASRTFLRLS